MAHDASMQPEWHVVLLLTRWGPGVYWIQKCSHHPLKQVWTKRWPPILQSRWTVPSGIPIEFRQCIWLSYTCHMTCRVIHLAYDRYMTTIFVRTKLVFISYRMDTWHRSALPIYRMSLYRDMHGVYCFKSYKVSKINTEYDSHIPFIWMVYTRIIMILYALRFYCQCDHETATASQNLLIHMHS